MRFLRIGAAVALAFAGMSTVGASAATPAWRVEQVKAPAGATDAYLNGVSCFSATGCAAVGTYDVDEDAGGPDAAGWDGARWKLQRTAPAVPLDLTGVSCVASAHCTAVGQNYDSETNESAPGAAVWNGTKWKAQHVPLPAASTAGGGLSGVSCTSASACVAVGGAGSGDTAQPLAEVWNGTKWAASLPLGPKASPLSGFAGVSCTSSTACIAVGESWNTRRTNTVSLAESWNGRAWTNQALPAPPNSFAAQLNSVSCTPSPVSCSAVGYYHLGRRAGPLTPLVERWDGESWSVQTAAHTVGAFWGVSCTSATACTAAGGLGTGITPLAERWDGASWTSQVVAIPAGTFAVGFFAVSCTAANECTAVGSDNVSSGHLQALVERFS